MEGGLYSAAHTSLLLKVCVQPPLLRRIHHRPTLKITAARVAPAAIHLVRWKVSRRARNVYLMSRGTKKMKGDERYFKRRRGHPATGLNSTWAMRRWILQAPQTAVIKVLLCNRGTASESKALKWLRINSRATKRLHWWPLFCVISKREIRTARCWWAVWGTIWSADRGKRG